MYNVLFICLANAGRSQMAQGFFNEYKKTYPLVDENYLAISGGLNPANKVGSISIEVMKELGIDISNSDIHYTKKIDKEMLRNAEYIICLDGSIDSSKINGFCPHDNWNIKDTYHEDMEIIRGIRDQISLKVKEFLHFLYKNNQYG